MKYVFTAKDASGNVKKGIVEAVNQDFAAQVIQRSGMTPVSIEREGTGFSFERELHKVLDRVTQKELVVFFRQLATLIEARVPVTSSLHALADQADNRYFQILLKEIAGDVEDGISFSDALARFPETFSPLVVNMVRAGELSGSLQKSILYIADNTEKNYTLSSRVKGALIYPGFTLTAAFIVGFIMVTVILPKLTQMIKDLNAPVPWYTTLVMNFGDFMRSYWWAVLILIFGFIGGVWFYSRTEDGRREWDILKLKLPVIGKLFRAVYIARFSENLGALLASGIPVVRSLHIVSDVVGNTVFQAVILRAADEVKIGKPMSSVFAKSPDVPMIVSRMIAIGEETGKTSHVLESTARFYSQEVDDTTRNLSSLMEPVLIVLLGIGVAILVMSIILPMYQVVGQMG